jgi:hypothetical protein
MDRLPWHFSNKNRYLLPISSSLASKESTISTN